jgi:prepilin-type processing-associated H-X9-DG protein
MAQVAYASEHHGAINTLRYEGESDYLDASQPVTDSFWGKMHPYLFSIPQVVNQVILRNDLELALKSLFSTKDVRLMSGTPFGGYPIYTDSSGLPLPVAFNSEIMPEFNQASRPVAAIGNPARIIYISYGYEKITPEDGQAYRERPDENSGDGRRGIFWLSTKKAILCFLDGHVETVSEPIPERFFSVQ